MDWQVFRVHSPSQAEALPWLVSFLFNFGAALGVKPRVSLMLNSFLALSNPFLNTAISEETSPFVGGIQSLNLNFSRNRKFSCGILFQFVPF